MTKAPTTATFGACCARAARGQSVEHAGAASEERDEVPAVQNCLFVVRGRKRVEHARQRACDPRIHLLAKKDGLPGRARH
jgi:hypothetical protein